MSTVKSMARPVEVQIRALCECGRYHDINCSPDQLHSQFEQWEYKHSRPGCKTAYVKQKHLLARDFDDKQFELTGKSPWWLNTKDFRENANFQLAFNASAALTTTSFNSLATDSNLLAGASSAVVDNGASGTLLDLAISAQIKNGTTPTTAKGIYLYVWAKTDDSTYPDAITGSDAAITITGTDAINNALKIACQWASTTTTGSTYPTGWHVMSPRSLSAFFGGWLPRYWGVWITHDTVAAFASSGHVVSQKASYVAG